MSKPILGYLPECLIAHLNRLRVPGVHQQYLMAMLYYSTHHGRCPSQAELISFRGISDHNISRDLKAMQSRGYIVIHTGKGHPNTYDLGPIRSMIVDDHMKLCLNRAPDVELSPLIEIPTQGGKLRFPIIRPLRELP